jgi:hypothetical protein
MSKQTVEPQNGGIGRCRARSLSTRSGLRDLREATNQPIPTPVPDCADAESQRVLSDASLDVAYALGEQAAEAYFRELLERQAS